MNDLTPSLQLSEAGTLAPALDRALRSLEDAAVVRRIWEGDRTVWKSEGREIPDRLGWLRLPETARNERPAIEAFAASARDLGLTRAVVLGMGGSSLAPDVYARLFDPGPGGLELEVLDTTEPETVAAAAARLAPEKTLFIVSSKSGTTAEVLALLSFFFSRVRLKLGSGEAGGRFVAVTDPGTPLAGLARELRFKQTFLAPPDVGGRFSALSVFGLLPAALQGIDLERLLAPARAMAERCRIESPTANPGAMLGAILGAAALEGRDKLTLLLPQRLRPLAGWLEQLVAESTGKEGRGIVPVIEDRPGPSGSYGEDRLFVEIGGAEGVGDPAVRLPFDDPYGLAGHFFLWEFATAVAGHILRIDPFDQPDVESAKKRTREVLTAADRPGRAAENRPLAEGGLRIAGPGAPEEPAAAWNRLLDGRRKGDYVALLAFLPRRPAIEELLSGLAAGIRLKTGLPVTVGFGPRYLHSTGQLHKGDGNRGLFLMLVPSVLPYVGIPAVPGVARPAGEFATLFRAQARGDGMALADKGRRVLTLELGCPLETALGRLAALMR